MFRRSASKETVILGSENQSTAMPPEMGFTPGLHTPPNWLE